MGDFGQYVRRFASGDGVDIMVETDTAALSWVESRGDVVTIVVTIDELRDLVQFIHTCIDD